MEKMSFEPGVEEKIDVWCPENYFEQHNRRTEIC